MFIMTEDGWKQLTPKVFEQAKDVFEEIPIEEARITNERRAHNFEVSVRRYLSGEISFFEVYAVFKRPLRGPYGERIS